MKYMRNDLNDDYGIIDLQEKLLEIMVDIDLFCNRYDIDYCLMAGSALGAERHKGFIPWDDDIDIYMTEKDFNKFRCKFEKYGDKKKYYLQEWGKNYSKDKSFVTMAKVRLNNSRIIENSYINWKMHQGLFVDIFILHNCPSNRFLQFKQYIWSELVVLKGLQARGYKSKGIKDLVMLNIIKFLPMKLILNKGLKETYKYQDSDTKFTHGFIDTRQFSRALFSKDIMIPGRYVEFENVKLKVPNDNKKYLQIQFGNDYMIPPTEDKKPINKHTQDWKISSSIIYNDFSDESKLI